MGSMQRNVNLQSKIKGGSGMRCKISDSGGTYFPKRVRCEENPIGRFVAGVGNINTPCKNKKKK